ncbi:cell division protein FtsK, partial [Priestia megaterium]
GWQDIQTWKHKKKKAPKTTKKRRQEKAVQEPEESMDIEVEAPSPPIIEHFDYGEEESSQSPAAPIAPAPPVMESKPVAAAPQQPKPQKE